MILPTPPGNKGFAQMVGVSVTCSLLVAGIGGFAFVRLKLRPPVLVFYLPASRFASITTPC